MPSIEALKLGIGDKVEVQTRPHIPRGQEFAPAKPKEKFTFTIVGLDAEGVYLHPWDERLAAWTRVQNTQTGEISVVRLNVVTAQSGTKELRQEPLADDERLVIAMNKHSDAFLPVDPN